MVTGVEPPEHAADTPIKGNMGRFEHPLPTF
jgi:hypothetical protein